MKTLIFMPASLQAAANQVGRQLQLSTEGTEGGEHTFTVPLFDGNAPEDSMPVSYWCAADLTPANHAAVNVQLPNFPGAQVFDYDSDGDPGFPQRKLAELNRRTARASFP